MSSMYPSGGPTRPCMRCGAALAPNQGQCARCGLYASPSQGTGMPRPLTTSQPPPPAMPQQGPPWANMPSNGQSWQPGMVQQGSPTATGIGPRTSALGSVDGSGWGATPQAGPRPQTQPFAGQNALHAPNGTGLLGQHPITGQNAFHSPNGTGFFGQHPNQSMPNSSPLSPTTFFQMAPPQNGYKPSWDTSNKQESLAWVPRRTDDDEYGEGRKKGPRAGVVALIVILVVALIGGGAFAGYKVLRSHNSNSVGSTPGNTTAQALTTPSVTPLFRETFQNNNAGWDMTPQTGAKMTINAGKLTLESDNNQLFEKSLPGGKSYGDLRLDVDATLTTGDQNNGYGVYIRGASTQNSPLGLYYRFEIYGDGSFVIYKGTQDANGNAQSAPLTSETAGPNKAIHPEGQTNHLTIVAHGTQLTFLVNGTPLASFNENSYKSGVIALFVSNVQHVAAGAQAAFENLAIFPAQ